MRLKADEREVVAVYNDAERSWHVYSDSATMRSVVLRLARQVGAEVEQVDEGVAFTCSGELLRLTAKRRLRLSPAQRSSRGVRLRSGLASRGQRRAGPLLVVGSDRA